MNCDVFRSRVDRLPNDLWPPEARAHHETCADCRDWWGREATWRRVFASAPAPAPRPSVWPGVMAAIAARRQQPASLSWELVALSRYVAPALAALVLIVGGVGLWQADLNDRPALPATASVLVAEPATELAFVAEDADAILNQWVEVSQP